jgi:glycerate dehydrogenase
LHCPLNEHTRDFIGARELALLKPGALWSTPRAVINEQALADALRNGHLGGAATDVLSVEPPVNGNPLLAAISRADRHPTMPGAAAKRGSDRRIGGKRPRLFQRRPATRRQLINCAFFKEQTMDPRSEVLLRQAELSRQPAAGRLPADDLLGRLPNAHGWCWHAGDQAALDTLPRAQPVWRER